VLAVFGKGVQNITRESESESDTIFEINHIYNFVHKFLHTVRLLLSRPKSLRRQWHILLLRMRIHNALRYDFKIAVSTKSCPHNLISKKEYRLAISALPPFFLYLLFRTTCIPRVSHEPNY
jgi:hypothetical protein